MSADLLGQLPEFVRGHKLATMPDPHDPKEDVYDGEHVPVEDIVLSKDNDGNHRPVLDIDFPAALIPSSTPGHFHLYLDKQLTTTQYMKLLDALAESGIIERGYASVSEARGYTSARLPWVKKKASA
jgi:hypothetical protein